MTNKFFFMAVLAGSLHGKPVVQFNTVSAQTHRNLTAASLANIQDAGAQMLKAEGVEFDNVLVNNVFFLAECTEEDFFRMDEVNPLEQAVADSVEEAQTDVAEAAQAGNDAEETTH